MLKISSHNVAHGDVCIAFAGRDGRSRQFRQEVPMATMVNPITASLTPSWREIVIVPLTMN